MTTVTSLTMLVEHRWGQSPSPWRQPPYPWEQHSSPCPPVINHIVYLYAQLWDSFPWEKNWPPWLLTVSSRWVHGDTVTKMVTASRDWAVTWAVIELWPSHDWAMIAVIELWPCHDWAVTYPWLSCDLAVTELWPSLAVTEPWSMGPGTVTTMVTVSSRWPFIFSWVNTMRLRRNGCQFAVFYWKKMYDFWLRFHWILFLRV